MMLCADIKPGMVLAINGKKPSWQVVKQMTSCVLADGRRIPVSNEFRNKWMMRKIGEPDRPLQPMCFDLIMKGDSPFTFSWP